MTLLKERFEKAVAAWEAANPERRFANADLARFAGCTRQTVGDWRKGRTEEISTRYLRKVAYFLGVNPDWLGNGVGAMLSGVKPSRAGVAEQKSRYNTASGPNLDSLVPLISFVQAGSWDEAHDPYPPGQGEEFMACPTAHGPNTYALRVEGDSMTAPFGKSYPHGSIIFVDPDLAGAVVSGDRVVAKLSGDSHVTFKVFVKDGPVRFLRPLNPQHPPIMDEFRVIGKVIGKFESD